MPAQPAAEPVNPPPAQPSVKPADRPTAAAASDAALSRYLRDIQRTGSRVLDESHYPATARGKGWAGTTQIDVQFAEGGFIRSILLGESSGYPDFDTRALEFARGIMFPPRPKVLYAREFTVRFPIAFKPGKAR